MTNYSTSAELHVDLAINFDCGITVGVASLCPFSENFLVLKENGCLQIWNNKEKSLVNRLFLNENVNLFKKRVKASLVHLSFKLRSSQTKV